jgi:hypothetical protein
MTFPERVTADLIAQRFERAFPDMKPSRTETLFSLDYNGRYPGLDSWSIRMIEGFLWDWVELRRGSVDDIPLTKPERKALFAAYKSAIEHERKIYKMTLGILRS